MVQSDSAVSQSTTNTETRLLIITGGGRGESVTQTEGADVDAAAADARQAANGEEEVWLRKDGGHEAAHGVQAHTHQQHRTLPVPADRSDGVQAAGATEQCVCVCVCACVCVCVCSYRSEMAPPNREPSSKPTM